MFLVQSVGAVEYTNCFSAEGWDPTNECPVYDTKQSHREIPSNAGALGNTEYLFSAIVPSSTLAQIGSIW